MNKPVLKNIGISKVQFGENVTIIEPVNLYGCAIGRNSFIGPLTIGNHCFIGHGVMFINDMMREGRPSGDKTKWEKTRIGNHVTIGSNATILAIEICDNVLIGAGSVVTKNISEAGVYAGNPAKKIEEKK
jgi:acetyltransferase-like isoleucine patch superfamily enzyme